MARIEDRVTGWWVFAGTLLVIVGVLNIIWGIAAIGDAKFFIAGQKYIISSLHSENPASNSSTPRNCATRPQVFAGGGFGRWMGMFAAALTAISALLSIPPTVVAARETLAPKLTGRCENANATPPLMATRHSADRRHNDSTVRRRDGHRARRAPSEFARRPSRGDASSTL